MENKLCEILNNLNLSQEYKVMLHGSLDSESIKPNNYFTYWCWDNARASYYDNKHSKNLMGYQICAYSKDEDDFLSEMLDQATKALEDNDFNIEDDWTDLSTSDKNYTAKVMDGYFIKKKEE